MAILSLASFPHFDMVWEIRLGYTAACIPFPYLHELEVAEHGGTLLLVPCFVGEIQLMRKVSPCLVC